MNLSHGERKLNLIQSPKEKLTIAEGGDIIIKGGSAEIRFDHGLFKQDEKDPQKHKHDTLKIKRIVISGDKGFDSGDTPNGFKGEIKITCEL